MHNTYGEAHRQRVMKRVLGDLLRNVPRDLPRDLLRVRAKDGLHPAAILDLMGSIWESLQGYALLRQLMCSDS